MNDNSLLLLESIKQLSSDGTLKPEDEAMIKEIFKKILSSGDNYNVSEIENWIGTVSKSQNISERIMNIAHYQKAKHDSNNKLKMMPDDCGCGGNC